MGVGVITELETLRDVEEATEFGPGAMCEEDEASVEEVVFIALASVTGIAACPNVRSKVAPLQHPALAS